VVVGLGLIGLLTVQMLLANGCKVIGVDLDERKCALARSFGAQALNPGLGDDPVQKVLNLTGVGADAVLITASAKGNELVSQAARMSRKRGRIVLVGVTGLELNRAEFYEKELTFQVSCSYGPGRYEPNYEGKGLDYPIGFVRWTEQRNFEAVLSMMASGALKVKELITRVVPFEDYATVYKSIEESQDIAILFAYPAKQITGAEKTIQVTPFEATASKGVIGLLGAGNFTKMTLLPALKGTGANVKTIVSAGGLSGTLLAKKFNIAQSSTDSGAVLNDPDINLVMITTRHGSHSRQVIQCLEAGKAVFVEKPLALDPAQLRDVIAAYTNHPNLVHVGFNRRFSPHVVGLKKHLGQGPHSIVATMNAGFIPVNHWVHDPEAGGGRIIGEACHMIDLCAYLTGSEVVSVSMNALGPSPELTTDCAQILLRFADGSQAVINYLANGSKAYAKERVEVYSHQRTAVIDNFVRTKVYGFRGWRGLKTTMDKGHKDQFGLLLNVVQSGGPPLIAFESLVNTTAASMAALKSLQEQRWVSPGEIINLPTA
jgi:predicted dehydrogenase